MGLIHAVDDTEEAEPAQRREDRTWRRSPEIEGRLMVDLEPKVKRTDAIQSFVSQETPIVRITDADGAVGTGYTYTIGTGGPSVDGADRADSRAAADRPRRR